MTRVTSGVGPRRPHLPFGPLGAVLALLLSVAAVVGLARLPGELTDQSRLAAAGRSMQQVDSVLVSGRTRQQLAFLTYVRRTVPPGDPVRIVQSITRLSPLEVRRGLTPGVCGYSTRGYFYLMYVLLPRPSTCDLDARWTMYYGVRPGPLPPGAVAHRFADDYVLVRR
jgi:hypothetical protein